MILLLLFIFIISQIILIIIQYYFSKFCKYIFMQIHILIGIILKNTNVC